jgi:hypothetical protein
VNGLHLNVARQLLTVMRKMRERVWAAANVVGDHQETSFSEHGAEG